MTNFAENRKERIKYLRKQEERNRRLPEFLNSLTSIAGYSITIDDVLSIDDSDAIWKSIRMNEKFHQANFSVSFPYRNKNKLDKVFEVLKSSLTGQKQYFTTYKYQDTCLLLIDTSFCVSQYEKLIEFYGDPFYIYNKDINNSLSVVTSEEHWRDKEEYTWTYELKVCGMDWIDKVFKAYKEVEAT